MCVEEAESREIRLNVGLTSLNWHFERIKVELTCQIAYGGFVVYVYERLFWVYFKEISDLLKEF